jgi:hypothetical protein
MPTPDLPQVEAAIIQMTNAFRVNNKLAPVKPDPVLRKAAEAFALYLAKTNSFSHTADGRQVHERTTAAGYAHCLVAENLALNMETRGFESRQLATDAVEGWKNSPGHRKNMLLANVTDTGVAVARAPGEHKYLSVQLFGRPSSARFEYRIINRSQFPVTYKTGSKQTTVDPRYTITHTECAPTALTFTSVKTGMLSSVALEQRFDPRPGDAFVIEGRTNGVTILHKPKAPRGVATQ